MKHSKKLLLGLSATMALGLSATPFTVSAQDMMSCDNVVFGPAITDRYPDAKASCLGIVEKDGKQYAKFTAEIDRVSGGAVYAKFLMPDGSYTRTFTFNPPSDARVRIQGRTYRYRDLSRGQRINIYVPPDRWAIATAASEEEFESPEVMAVTVVPLETASSSSSDMSSLPSTAGPVPLIGLLGGLFAMLGAGFTILRRRS